jgi:hypothetical protein
LTGCVTVIPLSNIAPHLHNLRKGRTKWAMGRLGISLMN